MAAFIYHIFDRTRLAHPGLLSKISTGLHKKPSIRHSMHLEWTPAKRRAWLAPAMPLDIAGKYTA
jgi:hypothetical protein